MASILYSAHYNLAAAVPRNFKVSCLTFRLIFYLFVEFWPTRESFGMARGPRFWALGIDSGPRGGAFEGIVDPQNNKKYMLIGAQTAPTLRVANRSPTRPSNPGLKSSALQRKNEGFPGSGGLESGPPGPDFEGFRAKAEG